MQFELFSKNGSILPVSEATISLFNIEYSYGFGVYENIRVKNNIPIFLSDHIERLFKSASLLKLEHQFSKNGIETFVSALVEKLSGQTENKLTLNLKVILVGAKEMNDAGIYLLPLAPLFPDKKIYTHGVKVVTATYERWMPGAKSLGMLPSYFYYSQAKKQGCYDVLFADSSGNITEGSRTNFFTIKGKTIFTPSAEFILPGVTRKHVIKVAKENGFVVVEGEIRMAKLKSYDGAFLTSTSGKVIPIKQICDFNFPLITAELKELMKLFDDYLSRQ